MLEDSYDAALLMEKGSVVEANGNTVEDVFKSICNQAKLPTEITSEVLVQELMLREKVLSTAVGNGIAIPHPRRPLVSSSDESRIIVAYLKSPIDMQAPDFRKVYAMFILLSSSSQLHIKTLSSLAKLFRNDQFKKMLQLRPGKEQLVNLIRRHG